MYILLNEFCYKDKIQLKGNSTLNVKPFSELNLNSDDKTQLDTVLLFQNKWDGNFRHFIKETFYLLSYVYSENFNDNGFHIMINKKYNKYTFQILEILELTKYIVFKEENHIYEINNLIYSNKTVNSHNNPDKNYTKMIDELINNSKKLSNITCYDKIYLSREHVDIFTETNTPKRWITNIKDATSIFYDKNYIQVIVDNLDFWDQVTLINSATNIVTFIGANCDNIAFANKDAKFTMLYASVHRGWGRWFNKNISYDGHELLKYDDSVVYNPEFVDNDPVNGPYIANIEHLKSILQ